MKPLCVDCDGTLVRTDTMFESLARLVCSKPLKIFLLPFWLLKGRAFFKARLFEKFPIKADSLPYRAEIVDFLLQEKKSGRKIYLVSGTDTSAAKEVASHLGCFDDVYGSDGNINLTSSRKATFLCEKFGEKGYDYIGDSRADLAVWAKADKAYVVSNNALLIEQAKEVNPETTTLPSVKKGWKDYIKLIRMHQWSKQFIVFVPLVTSHSLGQARLLLMTLGAFFALSFTASAIYIINDIFDLENDRKHKTKRFRPLAYGSISLVEGGCVAVAFAILAAIVSLFLPAMVCVMLIVYAVITITYSAYLKKYMLADVLVLAGLYTYRLLVGLVATEISPSVWLVTFGVFIFFSLALAKRYAEVSQIKPEQEKKVAGRGYLATDAPVIGILGISSGMVAVLIFCLYVDSSQVTLYYSNPKLLLLFVPVLLYWISRIWFLAYRSELLDDPVIFALKDKASYVVGLIALGILVLASVCS